MSKFARLVQVEIERKRKKWKVSLPPEGLDAEID